MWHGEEQQQAENTRPWQRWSPGRIGVNRGPNSLSPAEAETLAVHAGRGADQRERVRRGTGPAAAATTSADAQAATREAFMLTKI